jgi:tetrahydromethanopterin S-methyltransferase subunit G
MTTTPDGKLMTAEDWKSLTDSSNEILDKAEAERDHVIEMTGSAQTQYLSEKIGRDFGSPYGGWTTDIEKATLYTKAEGDTLLECVMHGVAPFCKVVGK